MSHLAIFDLDHTLITTDSDNAFPQFLIEEGLMDADYAQAKNAQFYQDYQSGCLNVADFVRFAIEPIKSFSADELAQLHQKFMQKHILPHITPMATTLVESHRAAGDTLLVISSTNEFIITPICQRFGIDNVIGTRLEVDSTGHFTGNIVGTPSLREGKITRLNEWLASRGETLQDYEKTYFYSDSKNDLPLLERVDEPVAVNPDEVLLQVAQERGWAVLNWIK